MHPDFRLEMAWQREAELRQAAASWRMTRKERNPVISPVHDAHLLLRLDRTTDEECLERLASLNHRCVPEGPFVVGEIDGRLVAALPLGGGTAIADPFVLTFHLLPLLELRAEQIRGADNRPARRLRLLPRRA